jgi:hypothetical protein
MGARDILRQSEVTRRVTTHEPRRKLHICNLRGRHKEITRKSRHFDNNSSIFRFTNEIQNALADASAEVA